MKKRWQKVLLISLVILVTGWILFYNRVNLQPPGISNLTALNKERYEVSKDHYTLGNNWIKKNKSGLWEMYVEGSAFERGVTIGKLSKELIQKQEDAFVEQIYEIVPSRIYLRFLKYFIAWFNRNLNDYVKEEFKEEIYGVSFAFSDEYDFIGTKYQRILNYHAAHDIGHALQDKRLVAGCTSFSAWDSSTSDHTLIVGRNFDFYAGDKFAEDKIISFYKPDQGYRFMMVTWGGMTGAVSGMNEKGLTVTINAAKSTIPSSAATPVSIVAREVLQYAGTISEAHEIIRNNRTFVSETFLIGSAADHKSALIEKSPDKTGLHYSDSTFIICSNHYQSDPLKNEQLNLDNIANSSSEYRYQRMSELIKYNLPLDIGKVSGILRNQKGMHDKNIGMGNEKAINQMIAHHAVIFKPEERRVWVSSNPFQLGEFVCYDLTNVFSVSPAVAALNGVSTDTSSIAIDSFLLSGDYQSFLRFKSLRKIIHQVIKQNTEEKTISDQLIAEFIKSNPEYYDTYRLAGDYYRAKKEFEKASQYYEMALSKEVATLIERDELVRNRNEMIRAGR